MYDVLARFGPKFLGNNPARRGIAMADVQSEVAFGRAAASFDVHESDYLVLVSERVSTMEAMAFRFPQASDFEDFVKKVVRTKSAYRDREGTVVTYPRSQVKAWDDYRHHEDVGCLRKLWTLSSQASKKKMERLAGEDSEMRTKVTLTLAQELEDRAIEAGMPPPINDRERPSLHTLTKVQGTFGPGGSYQHISWEAYINMDTENRLHRAGKLPKDKKEVIVGDEKLELRSKELEIGETNKIEDPLALHDVMQLRARAFQMMEVCGYGVAMEYGGKFISLLRAPTPVGMRAPTMNEVRQTDREIMSEILKWVGKGRGSLEDGLAHYARNPDESLWKMMAQQPENLPDQGKERALKQSGRGEGEGEDRKPQAAKRPRSPDPGDDYDRNPRFCLVCRKRHEPRCTFPPEWRREQKEKKKARAANAKAKKAAQNHPSKDGKGGGGGK